MLSEKCDLHGIITDSLVDKCGNKLGDMMINEDMDFDYNIYS